MMNYYFSQLRKLEILKLQPEYASDMQFLETRGSAAVEVVYNHEIVTYLDTKIETRPL